MDKVVELNGEEGLKKIGALIKKVHTCMMTTAAADGSFDSRPMATQNTDFDGTLWFLIKGKSLVSAEIAQDAHVSLMYSSPSDSIYMVAKGQATVNQDDAKIKELWSPIYEAWFPDGETDPSLSVLRVAVTEAQYWEASPHKLVNRVRYVAAAVTGGKVAVGETGKIIL